MRKISGGKYRKARKKKLSELKGKERVVKLGKEKKKKIMTRGGKLKTVLLSTNKVNLFLHNKKYKVVEIKSVLETPSNKFLARSNVLIKGAIIETAAGKAKITNRPGQEGSVQAILI